MMQYLYDFSERGEERVAVLEWNALASLRPGYQMLEI